MSSSPCANCGKSFADSEAFCPRCGSARAGAASLPPSTPLPDDALAGRTVPRASLTKRVADEALPGPIAEPRAVEPEPEPEPEPMNDPELAPEPTPTALLSDVAPVAGAASSVQPVAPTAVHAEVASIGSRFVAFIIDSFLVGLLVTVLYLGMFVVAVVPLRNHDYGAALVLLLWLEIVGYIGVASLGVSYTIAYNGRGGTIGKRVLGVRVVDVTTGDDIGMSRSFLRYLMMVVMSLPCYLGFLSPFWDSTKRNRGWHDAAANDIVIKTAPISLGKALLP